VQTSTGQWARFSCLHAFLLGYGDSFGHEKSRLAKIHAIAALPLAATAL
jgi:hypothetical protein